MKLTNRTGLPQVLVDAIAHDDYDRGDSDITCTELVNAPQIVELRRRHDDELVEDASERIWMLMGKLIHKLIEDAADANTLTEERLYATVRGWKVSAQLDHYTLDHDGLLVDWKCSAVWAAKDGGREEWVRQLQVIAWLLREHGFPVSAAKDIVLCRDWRRNEARRYGEPYPQLQVAEIPVALWSHEECERYISERVALHQAARAGAGVPCTPDEQWRRPDMWAHMRSERKSAVKLYPTQAEAEAAAVSDTPRKGKAFVEFRAGTAVRCAEYCAVRAVCPQRVREGTVLDGEAGDVAAADEAAA